MVSRTSNGDDDLVRLYLTDIGKHPLLTKEDEGRLSRLVQEGLQAQQEIESGGDKLTPKRQSELRLIVQRGEEAKNIFVQSNLRLVVSIAKKHARNNMPILDLIQEGNIGLMRAVEKFDWTKGFKFSTYATWWIRQSMSRGTLDLERPIRLPVHTQESLHRLQKAQARLEQQLGRQATIEELCQEEDMKYDVVVNLLQYRNEALSLSAPMGESGEVTLSDMIEDENAYAAFESLTSSLLSSEFEDLLDTLDEKEKDILRRRFGLDGQEPQSLAEVGKLLNLTKERIRQIEIRILVKLRHKMKHVDVQDLLVG